MILKKKEIAFKNATGGEKNFFFKLVSERTLWAKQLFLCKLLSGFFFDDFFVRPGYC